MEACRFLRPCLHQTIRSRAQPVHARFFAAISRLAAEKGVSGENDYQQRITQLKGHAQIDQCYPRIKNVGGRTERASVAELRRKFDGRLDEESLKKEEVTISGRVISVRFSGSKLVFLDLEDEGLVAQVLCNFGNLTSQGVAESEWKSFRHIARRGDWFSASGIPTRTRAGEPGLQATKLPALLAPSLHQVPKKLDDANTKARRPHVDMLVYRKMAQTLQVRSIVEHRIASRLVEKGFHKVITPLLGASSGGAVARPFETVATEMQDTKLSLRIAPELWLKRLMVGGMGRVFEMGPAFRNEGIDATHNPEFTICEFYMQFAELEGLMSMTEALLADVYAAVNEAAKSRPLDALEDSICHFGSDNARSEMLRHPYKRLRFIPILEAQMGRKLPDLDQPDTQNTLLGLFAEIELDVPAKATLPRLLDALCARFIEPMCIEPTFITEHPAVMSPLSKSYRCEETRQMVSARAELFIRGHEYANMYEEENSPFEQRKKFIQQLKFRAVDGEIGSGEADQKIDESYIEALEWGLPPTGGWGMGVDRLVMLLTGQKRISDVLPFGNLRNVVGIASRQT